MRHYIVVHRRVGDVDPKIKWYGSPATHVITTKECYQTKQTFSKKKNSSKKTINLKIASKFFLVLVITFLIWAPRNTIQSKTLFGIRCLFIPVSLGDIVLEYSKIGTTLVSRSKSLNVGYYKDSPRELSIKLLSFVFYLFFSS